MLSEDLWCNRFASEIKKMDLPADTESLHIYITEVESVTRFWFNIHGPDQHKALEILDKDMDEFYKNINNRYNYKVCPDKVVPGLPVAAKYDKDYGYNRGIVQSVDTVRNVAKVFFCDYGSTTVLEISSLNYLGIQFQGLEMQALYGRLWGLDDSYSSKEGFQKFMDYVRKNITGYKATIRVPFRDKELPYPIPMYLVSQDSRRKINKDLVQHGFSKWTDERSIYNTLSLDTNLLFEKDFLKDLLSENSKERIPELDSFLLNRLEKIEDELSAQKNAVLSIEDLPEEVYSLSKESDDRDTSDLVLCMSLPLSDTQSATGLDLDLEVNIKEDETDAKLDTKPITWPSEAYQEESTVCEAVEAVNDQNNDIEMKITKGSRKIKKQKNEKVNDKITELKGRAKPSRGGHVRESSQKQYIGKSSSDRQSPGRPSYKLKELGLNQEEDSFATKGDVKLQKSSHAKPGKAIQSQEDNVDTKATVDVEKEEKAPADTIHSVVDGTEQTAPAYTVDSAANSTADEGQIAATISVDSAAKTTVDERLDPKAVKFSIVSKIEITDNLSIPLLEVNSETWALSKDISKLFPHWHGADLLKRLLELKNITVESMSVTKEDVSLWEIIQSFVTRHNKATYTLYKVNQLSVILDALCAVQEQKERIKKKVQDYLSKRFSNDK